MSTRRCSLLPLFTVLLLIGTSRQVTAQITLTESFYLSLIGESYEMAEFSTSDGAQLQAAADAEGTDQTYDFTGVTYGETFTGRISYYGSAEGLPGGSEFGSSNFVIEVDLSSMTDDSTAWVFGLLEEEAVYAVGGSFVMEDPDTGEEDTLTFAYDPPMRTSILPLEYGAEWTDTTSFFGIQSVVTRQVDGYGTLETPDGSAEALRISVTTVTETFAGSTTSYAIEFVTLEGLSARLELDSDGETVTAGQYSSSAMSPVSRERTDLPERVELGENYPDPFNPATHITFRLEAPSHVTLTVHDALGREVATLIDGYRQTGRHDVAFRAAGLPSGTYFYRLHTEGRVETRSMTLSK